MPVKNAINMPYVKPEAMEVIKPYLSLAEKSHNTLISGSAPFNRCFAKIHPIGRTSDMSGTLSEIPNPASKEA